MSARNPSIGDQVSSPEHGYVLPMTALLLIPLMIFAAFSVDIGGWYLQAAEAQRAADSAALAAVVRLPDLDSAGEAAIDAARRNGFIDQPGCESLPCSPTAFPQVITTPLGEKSVRVTIMTEGEAFFGGVVSDATPTIERAASAEYVLPVPLGNPTSSLGTGNLYGSSATSEPWLMLHGRCKPREHGDLISASHQTIGCKSGTNPQFDEDGYYAIIDMPEGSEDQTWNVEFYSPGGCWLAPRDVPTRFETTLYRADNTGFTDQDNIDPGNIHPAAPGVDGQVRNGRIEWNPGAGCNDAPSTSPDYTGRDEWVVANQIRPDDPRGRWVLNYRGMSSDSQEAVFSVRVTPAAGPNAGQICSKLDTTTAAPCPSVFARDWMVVFAHSTDRFGASVLEPGEVTSFYLAEISDDHAGKTLELRLFDAGEGMDNVQIIAPDLTRYPMTYATIDCADMGYCRRADIAESTHDVCATSADPDSVPVAEQTTPTAGNYPCVSVLKRRFNDRTMRLLIDLPDDYSCVSGNCWWRIRYTPTALTGVNDATTWSARVIGDPLRLVD